MAAKKKAARRKRPAHRPSEFDAKAPGLLDAIATGAKGLHQLHRDDPEKFPHPRTILRWLDEREDFRAQYARAKEAQAHFIAYEGVEILDDCDDSRGKASTPCVMKAREQATYRRWLAGRLAPKVYGDTTKHELSGPDGGSIPLATFTDLAKAARE